ASFHSSCGAPQQETRLRSREISRQQARFTAARQSLQEIADAVSDFAGMCFEREVAGVEEADKRTRIVTLESLGTRRHKERVIFAPHRQKRRLVSAEIVLK